MLEKTWSIICDGCGSNINHWTGWTKQQVIQHEREDGTIFYKGKHFCTEQCKQKYFRNNK